MHISIRSAFTIGYNAAIQAKEAAREKLPQTIIEVLDSRTSTVGTLLIALEAARTARQGKGLDEVIEIANNRVWQINFFSMPASPFCFDKGGFLREVQPWVKAESVSSFRAILECDASISGTLFKPVARAKTKSQIAEKMLDIAKARTGGKNCTVL